MLNLIHLDPKNKSLVRRFIEVPFQFYEKTPEWVPPIRIDVATALNRDKHPFYEHSDADFFLVTRDWQDVGRIAVL